MEKSATGQEVGVGGGGGGRGGRLSSDTYPCSARYTLLLFGIHTQHANFFLLVYLRVGVLPGEAGSNISCVWRASD